MRSFFLFLGVTTGLFLGFRWSPFPMIPALLFLLVCLVSSIRRKNAGWLLVGATVGFSLSLLRLIPQSAKTGEFYGIVSEVKNNYYILRSGPFCYYVYEKGTTREVGDLLLIYGRRSPFVMTEYESRFSFSDFLEKKGVVSELRAYRITEKLRMPIRFREKELSFLSHFEEEDSALLDSLLFGRKNYETEAIALAQGLSLLSVFSASGLIFGKIIRIVQKTLSHFVKDSAATAISLCIGFLLLPFSWGKVGVWRCLIYGSLSLINQIAWKRKFNYLSLVSSTGLFLLFCDFRLAYSSGFLIGFSCGIILYLMRGTIARKSRYIQPFLSSLLVYAIIFPLTLSQGKLHLFYWLFSMISIPFSVGFTGIGFVSFVSVPFTHVLTWYAKALRGMLVGFAMGDFSIPIPIPSNLVIVFYYASLLIFLVFSEIGHRPFRIKFSMIQVGVYCLSLCPILPAMTAQVSFVNVGQGDSIVIRDGMSTVMIDTGGNPAFDMAGEVDIPFLRKERIYKIDYLIATHGDFDHSGAVGSLISNFPVRHYVTSADSFPIDCGPIHLENLNVYGGSEENDKSLVISLTFIGKKWLFMGDCPEYIEKKIVRDNPNLDCDILKAGHHGSDTSSCEEFLKRVSPEVAIVSVGAKNQYGHPSPSVMARFEKLGVKVRRTDQEGTITYRCLKGFTL